MSPTDVWVVIAAFNEASRIAKAIEPLVAHGWNVVVIDDGSTDATADIASNSGAITLSHFVNRGQGAALQTGFDFVLSQQAKWVVTFDGDGQHRAADILRLLEPLQDNRCDVVLGSRFLGEAIAIPWQRRLLLKAAVRFTRVTTGLNVTDTHNGLRAMSAATAKRIRLQEDRMAHASEFLHQVAHQKLRYLEVPVTVQYHQDTLLKGQRTRDAWNVLARLMLSRLFT